MFSDDAMLLLRLAFALLVAEFLNVAQVAEGVQEFRRCFNTSEEETHCLDVQYSTTTIEPLRTSFENAQMRCRSLNSTLVIIENEEIDHLIQQFMNDINNPIRKQNFWLNAYKFNDFNNPYRWHWLNSTLPNLPGSAVSYTHNSNYYTAALEFRNENGKSQFYLTAYEPEISFYYVCEFSVSNCSSANSNDVRLMNGRCYRAVQELVTWYEARNRCLTGGGDLASFANVTSINFTSWLRSESYTTDSYWIGLRFIWYTWGDSGQELKYTNWASNGDRRRPCLLTCSNCIPTYAWASKDCNTTDRLYVVCHTITPLVATTASMVKTSISAASASSTTTLLTSNIQQVTPPSFRATDGALGIGLGVGLGVPLVISIILVVFFAVKSKRSETPLEQKTRSDRTELGAVQEPSVGQVNDSANSPYEQLNRNLDNSSGPMYDELRVAPETQYEEVPSNRA